MESKYYTPEIEEFHVGFEVQKQMQDLIGKELSNKLDLQLRFGLDYQMNHEATFADYTITANDIINYKLNPHILKTEIRVKHLGQEDIESLGWKFCNVNSEYFTLNGFHLTIYNYNWITIYEDKGADEYCFRGNIKNKSELRKLMQQLNINSGKE